MLSIAIDGPSGSGKSTLAKTVAKRMSILYLDTGALYRAVGLAVLEQFGDGYTAEQVVSLLGTLQVDLFYHDGEQHVTVNGADVSGRIRTQPVAMAASRVSALPQVRAFLLELQRGIARRHDVVMDGRDVGTVVLPDATVKIFLTASDEVRARRRFAELRQKGIEADFETVLREIRQRDEQDTHRAVAPLRRADDAVLLDNSDLDAEQTVAAVLDVIGSKVAL